MTWLEQVVHVLRWDVRRHGWLLLGFLAVSGAAAVAAWREAFMGVAQVGAWLQFASTLWLPLGALAAAWIVQSSPATGPHAHWPTLPLSRSAMATAKGILVAMLLVVVPALLTFVALGPLDLTTADRVETVARGVGLQLGLVGVLAALMVASPDIRSFVIVGALAWMGTQVLTSTVPTSRSTIAVALPLALGGVGAWYAVYGRRRVGPGLAVAAVGVVAAAGLGRLGPPAPFEGLGRPIPPEVRPEAVVAWVRNMSLDHRNARGVVTVGFAVEGASAHRRYELRNPVVLLVRPDGAPKRRIESFGRGVVIRDARPVGAPDGRYPVVLPSIRSVSVRVDELEALQAGDLRLRVDGYVRVLQPEERARLAIREGTRWVGGGAQVQVLGVRPEHNGETVMVQSRALRLLDGGSLSDGSSLRTSLIDADGQWIRLVGGSRGAAPGGLFLLPGLQWASITEGLRIANDPPSAVSSERSATPRYVRIEEFEALGAEPVSIPVASRGARR